MKYIRLQSPFYISFENVELINVYKSEEGKCNYYGVLKVNNDENLDNLNIFLQKYNIRKFNNILRFKFPTHYGKPRYRATGLNGLPTVASVLETGIVDIKIKIEGFMDNNVVLQCDTLIMKSA